MSKNIILLCGSPRKGGNTDKLATAFLKGAESVGKNVSLFHVADMSISFCVGCSHCFEEKGVCIHKDDMQKILDAIRNADTLVFASPVYFCSVSAQLKLVLDRMCALTSEQTSIKHAALLMTCADETSDTAEGAVVMYKSVLAYKKWDNAGVIIATGLYGDISIDGREELEQARKLGQEI
jgi:multimeric flavodoxin WrbA